MRTRCGSRAPRWPPPSRALAAASGNQSTRPTDPSRAAVLSSTRGHPLGVVAGASLVPQDPLEHPDQVLDRLLPRRSRRALPALHINSP